MATVTMYFNVPVDQAASWSASNTDFTSGFSADIAAALGIDASRVVVFSTTST